MKSSLFLIFLQTIISYQVTIILAFSPSPRSSTVTTSRSSPLSIGSLFSLLPPSQKKSITKERIKEIKDEIKNLSKGTSNGISASEEVRSQISTLVTELESSNPTPNLTSSEKLDGSWKLIYTTNEGSSAGKLGPFVGEVEQFIRIKGYEREDYINYVRIGGGLVEGALTATWDVLSKNKWQVHFESVKFKLFGITLADKELSAVGIWRMTYLDENFRILYAAGGKNVPKENIYILGKGN
jgi:hypothetical protein